MSPLDNQIRSAFENESSSHRSQIAIQTSDGRVILKGVVGVLPETDGPRIASRARRCRPDRESVGSDLELVQGRRARDEGRL